MYALSNQLFTYLEYWWKSSSNWNTNMVNFFHWHRLYCLIKANENYLLQLQNSQCCQCAHFPSIHATSTHFQGHYNHTNQSLVSRATKYTQDKPSRKSQILVHQSCTLRAKCQDPWLGFSGPWHGVWWVPDPDIMKAISKRNNELKVSHIPMKIEVGSWTVPNLMK